MNTTARGAPINQSDFESDFSVSLDEDFSPRVLMGSHMERTPKCKRLSAGQPCLVSDAMEWPRLADQLCGDRSRSVETCDVLRHNKAKCEQGFVSTFGNHSQNRCWYHEGRCRTYAWWIGSRASSTVEARWRANCISKTNSGEAVVRHGSAEPPMISQPADDAPLPPLDASRLNFWPTPPTGVTTKMAHVVTMAAYFNVDDVELSL